ncbi:MAG TPA: hypothetical protein VF323_03965 [Candidatus Limnocylindrales bacterium]
MRPEAAQNRGGNFVPPVILSLLATHRRGVGPDGLRPREAPRRDRSQDRSPRATSGRPGRRGAVITLAISLAMLFVVLPGAQVGGADAASMSTRHPATLPTPKPIPKPQTYTANLYDARLVRYQDPDYTACVATVTQMMLNFVSSKGAEGTGFRWTRSTSYATQENILAWERAHDAYAPSSMGTDPHGWRNGLNYYGWGSYANASTMVYQDLSYASYNAAVKAAVTAIATFDKPVGILGWAGAHAQFINGYEVFGQDPAVSSDFRVVAVYLTDPLRSDGLRNARISDANFKSGSTTYRFRPYAWKDSPYDDPYTPGNVPSYKEWYGRWVILAPVR